MTFCPAKKVGGACVLSIALLAASPALHAQTAPPRQPRIVESVRNDQLTTLRGNVHPAARLSANDRGALPLTQPITRMHLLLQRSAAQEAALQTLMEQQLDPKSANYHAWLSPQQFGEQFGPADSDIQVVRDWLSSQGFSDLKVNNGKTIIEFSGTAGQVQSAFHTEVHRLNVRGHEHFANVAEPQIPRALAPVVSGVVGLHNFHPKPLLHRLGKFRRNAATGEISPLFTFTDVNGTFYGVGPSDFATIYNVPSTLNAANPATTYDGSGVSIAVVGQSNVNSQDIIDYKSIFGLPLGGFLTTQPSNCPLPGPNICVVVNGPDPGLVSGDEGESDLDLELSSGVAPHANILFVTTQTSQTDGVSGVDASAEFIVDNNIAPILSESYGSCESGLGTAGNQFYALLWQQGAAEGITEILAAGDEGPAACDDPNSETSAASGIAISGIASTPFDVAMGGTDFNQAGDQTTFWNTANSGSTQISAKGYIPEMPWNDSCAATGLTGCSSVTTTSGTLNIVAGSGGPSTVYSKPAFQQGGLTGMPSDGFRDIPDLSLFSSDGGAVDSTGKTTVKSFYIVCQSDQDITGDTGCNLTTFSSTTPFHDFQAVGGTSAAAPAFAGIMALINQKTGQRQGNANVELYALAKAEPFASCDSSQGTSGSSSNTTCVFNDITGNNSTSGNTPNLNNSVACAGASTNCSKTTSGGFGVLVSSGVPAFSTGLGYDLATGLGSPNVTNLIKAWTTPGATGTATTVTISPSSITGTAASVSGNLTGKVSAGSGTPTGQVIFENAATGAPLGSTALSGGNYSLAEAFLPEGTYTLKAHYTGDGTFAPADSPAISVSLTPQASKVLVSFVNAAGNLVTSSQTVAYGSSYILRVDVTNSAGTPCANASTGAVSFVCPTGSIALLDSGQALNDFPQAQNNNFTNISRLNNRGFAEDQPIQLAAGSHTITATYTADASSAFTSSGPSNSLSVTITQAATTTSVSASPTVVISGGSVTLTATVNSSSNSAQGPTGTVQFLNGGSSLGSAATCTPTPANNSATPPVGALCKATLSTTLSALPPGFLNDPRPRNTPLVFVTGLAAALALLSFLLAMATTARRRQYAFASVAFLMLAAAALAGCGGGSSSSGGGGGGSARTISAKYSGDSNYAGSTSSSISVTVQ